jgi:transposase
MAVRYSKISDFKIKKIIRCFCADIDATKTSIILGLNRKTINHYFHLFREQIYNHQIQDFNKFFGIVEVDESYFGPSRIRGRQGPCRRGRGTWRQPVFGVFEREGRVFTEIIPDCKKETLRKIILGKISLESTLLTDCWTGYSGLVDVGYDKHIRIDKSKAFSNRNGVHINGIESFWSFTKRRLSKFNGVKRYFDLHLKECEWRWKKSQTVLEKELWKMLLK